MLDQALACADGRQAGMSLPSESRRVLVAGSVGRACVAPAVRLFVGAHGSNIAHLTGDRCFSAAHDGNTVRADHPYQVRALLDSGAFTDGPADRLTPEEALIRQLDWERKSAFRWHAPHWQAEALVSYDRLIDETWSAGTRHKRRWTVRAAESAVTETVDAAAYLASQRRRLAPRRLVLSCQGVDAPQYAACARAVLACATPEDWIGLGGWCILGRFTSWLPTFWATLSLILPAIAEAGVRHVHIFGVLYRPALGGLVWLADQHHLTVSTDSSAPARAGSCTTERARKKAGARADTLDGNVAWWRAELARLRSSPCYRQPPRMSAMMARQAELWSGWGEG